MSRKTIREVLTRKKNQPVRRDTSVVLHVLLVVLHLVVLRVVAPQEDTCQVLWLHHLHLHLHLHHHHQWFFPDLQDHQVYLAALDLWDQQDLWGPLDHLDLWVIWDQLDLWDLWDLQVPQLHQPHHAHLSVFTGRL